MASNVRTSAALEAERKLLKIERLSNREKKRAKELDAELEELKASILEQKALQASYGQKGSALRNLGSSNLAVESLRYRNKLLNRLEELFTTTQREENAISSKVVNLRREVDALRKEAMALNSEFLTNCNSLDTCKVRLALSLEQANAIVKGKAAVAERVELIRGDLAASRQQWLEERQFITSQVRNLLAASFLEGSKKKKKHARLQLAMATSAGAGTPSTGDQAYVSSGANGSAAVTSFGRPSSSSSSMLLSSHAQAAIPASLGATMAPVPRRREQLSEDATGGSLGADKTKLNRFLIPMTTSMLRHGPGAILASSGMAPLSPPQAALLGASGHSSRDASTERKLGASKNEGAATSTFEPQATASPLARPSQSFYSPSSRALVPVATPHSAGAPAGGSPPSKGAPTANADGIVPTVVGMLTPEQEEKLTIKARRMAALVEALENDAPRQAHLLQRWEKAFEELHRAAASAAAASDKGAARASNADGDYSSALSIVVRGESKEHDEDDAELASSGFESIIQDPAPLIKQFLREDASHYAAFAEIAEVNQETEMVEDQTRFLQLETQRLVAERAASSRMATVKQLEGKLMRIREINLQAEERGRVLSEQMLSVGLALSKVCEMLNFPSSSASAAASSSSPSKQHQQVNALTRFGGSGSTTSTMATEIIPAVIPPESLLSTLALVERKAHRLLDVELASVFPAGSGSKVVADADERKTDEFADEVGAATRAQLVDKEAGASVGATAATTNSGGPLSIRPPSVGEEPFGSSTAVGRAHEDTGASKPAAGAGAGLGLAPPVTAAELRLQQDYEVLRKNRRASLSSILDGKATATPGPAQASLYFAMGQKPIVEPRPGTSYSHRTPSGNGNGGGGRAGRPISGDDRLSGGNNDGLGIDNDDTGTDTAIHTVSGARASYSMRGSLAAPDDAAAAHRFSHAIGPPSAIDIDRSGAQTSGRSSTSRSSAEREQEGGQLFLVERVPGRGAHAAAANVLLTPSAVASAIKARAGRNRSSLYGQGTPGPLTATNAAQLKAHRAMDPHSTAAPVESTAAGSAPMMVTSLLTTPSATKLTKLHAAAIAQRPQSSNTTATDPNRWFFGRGGQGAGGADQAEEGKGGDNSSGVGTGGADEAEDRRHHLQALASQYESWLAQHMPSTAKAVITADALARAKAKAQRLQTQQQQKVAGRPLSSVKLQPLQRLQRAQHATVTAATTPASAIALGASVSSSKLMTTGTVVSHAGSVVSRASATTPGAGLAHSASTPALSRPTSAARMGSSTPLQPHHQQQHHAEPLDESGGPGLEATSSVDSSLNGPEGLGALGEVNSALMNSVLLALDGEEEGLGEDASVRFYNQDTGALLLDDEDDDEDEEFGLGDEGALKGAQAGQHRDAGSSLITQEVDRALLATATAVTARAGSAKPSAATGMPTLRAKTRSLDNLEKAFELASKASSRLQEAERCVDAISIREAHSKELMPNPPPAPAQEATIDTGRAGDAAGKAGASEGTAPALSSAAAGHGTENEEAKAGPDNGGEEDSFAEEDDTARHAEPPSSNRYGEDEFQE